MIVREEVIWEALSDRPDSKTFEEVTVGKGPAFPSNYYKREEYRPGWT